MTPLLSFIVTYHDEPQAMFRACMESIRSLRLRQEEAEIIVVDDGSCTEPCMEGDATGWAEGPKEVLIRQEQAGLSVARNRGLNHARGQYIQFVDADDMLIPSVYDAVIELLRDAAADVVLFNMTRRQKSHAAGRILRRCSGADYVAGHSLRAAACGYAFRRDVLGDLRFRPGLLHEDELFTPLLFLKAETLVEIDAKAYFYRQHSGTITNRRTSAHVQKRLDDMQFILRELRSLDNPLLRRRIHQFTVDYLQKTYTLTHSLGELRRRWGELKDEGFLPLPPKAYSFRYLFYAIPTRLSPR